VVEDDEAVRGLTTHLLRMSGYTVLEARHGVEALDLLAHYTGPLHLLVTDLVMPQMSGRTLADVLTAQRPGLRVLFLSGYSDASLFQPKADGETVPLMTKPFTPTTLAAKVRETLDRTGAVGAV
jgi:CheY-like chemotaxis protein